MYHCPEEPALFVVAYRLEGESMSSVTRVRVRASDPVSEAGVASQLRYHSDFEVLSPDAHSAPDVVVLVADRVDEGTVRIVRELRQPGGARVVLVVGGIDGSSVLAAVEVGVAAIVRRSEATTDRLATAIHAAATGDGHLPPDLLGRLLQQVGETQRHKSPPAGLTFGGLTQRELTVLSLIAEGYSTSEIATKMAYSERTIKNAIHDLVSRFQLRNRSHAVAFAVRQGLI
jgi:DNA-binding NarL/FixJ family response regulator